MIISDDSDVGATVDAEAGTVEAIVKTTAAAIVVTFVTNFISFNPFLALKEPCITRYLGTDQPSTTPSW